MKAAKKSVRMEKSSASRGKTIPISWGSMEQFKVPIPKDEPQRLAALKAYDILDTAPEQTFDDIAKLAAHICHTPMALIVLIDEHRQWFKARVEVNISETPREIAFCAHTIMQRRILVVEDNAADKRFAKNPLVVKGPKIRFYAGAPLITPDNRALGTVCVLDRVPRTLSAEQQHDLVALSRVVMTQLELRRSLLSERLRSNGRSKAALKRLGFEPARRP